MKCKLCDTTTYFNKTYPQQIVEDEDNYVCSRCKINSDKFISNFSHNKVLGTHAVCCALNGFTHFEYYPKREVMDFVKELIAVIPDTKFSLGVDDKGNERFITAHKKIKEFAGVDLIK